MAVSLKGRPTNTVCHFFYSHRTSDGGFHTDFSPVQPQTLTQ
uniref:Uncharacterized protein n=1 Tax=Anguilla anguilla TaxID=7936 RepID=A0A0E9QJC4_ANGAN